MKNSFLLSIWILFSAVCIAESVTAETLLQDPNFERGYEVMAPNRDIYTDRAEFETIFRLSPQQNKKNKDTIPSWRLVQWGSKKSLAKSQALDIAGGGKNWSVFESSNGVDKPDGKKILYKSVVINKDASSLQLDINGLPEFSGTYLTTKNEFWPHLLMAQNINSKKLDQYKAINLGLDANLLFDEKNMRDGYSEELHAARYVVSMVIRNTFSHNSFWLNLVIYDDRYPQSGFLCQKCRDKYRKDCYVPKKIDDTGAWLCPFDGDRWSKVSQKKGTRRMIFRIPTSAATQDDIRNGDWARYRVDLLPYIKAGLEAAQGEEALRGFLPSLRYCDITLFSMGWEVTGLNHAAMDIKNLSLNGL